MTGQRLHGLDFLRALMMALGLVLHSAQMYLTMPIVDYYWDSARSISMDVLLITINTFRMPVFFLLSGFFGALLITSRGEVAMFANRVQRLLWPFLVCLPPLALVMTLLRIIAAHIMVRGTWGFDVALVEPARLLWDNTHNLWFLYYLLMHIATWYVLLIVVRWPPGLWRQSLATVVSRTPIYNPSVVLSLVFGLAGLGAAAPAGRLSAVLSFMPDLLVYLYFGLCFVAGWWLWQRRQDLPVLARFGARLLVLATVLLLLALAAYLSQGEADTPGYSVRHALLSVLTGASMVAFMYGFVGLFSRLFTRASPWVRYLSDSAYWIFIFHSVPVVALALCMHDWPLPAEVKFLLVVTGSALLCLVSYQLCVRRTWLGRLLNGRTYDSVPWARPEKEG